MKQTSLEFDQKSIDSAVAKIQAAAGYLGKLGGFLPDEPMGLAVLRQHIADLREGLAVLTSVGDALQQHQERQVTHTKKR